MAENLSWGNLPNIPRVMFEFAAGNKSVFELLGGDYRDPEIRQWVAKQRLAKPRISGLGGALRDGYRSISLTSEMKSNLKALDKPDVLTVVTGQQVGLFGGPLFTYYKALTAVLLARHLTKEVSVPVVPVFWMETADADFGEVNRIAFPPDNGMPRGAIYSPSEVVAGKSVSMHHLNDEINDVRLKVESWMQSMPFGAYWCEAIERSYQPGRTMSEAFRELLTDQFGDTGLIAIDPRSPEVIELTQDFWIRALERPDKLNSSFTASAREVSDLRLSLQVQLRQDALPVLHVDEFGNRKRILGESDSWRIGADGVQFDNKELRRMAREDYSKLTPGVLLRPLLQDYLLPTWIYVGGPAEVSYHAQINRAYAYMDIPRPLIAPRVSATIVEKPTRRLLERHGWSVVEVLAGREMLLRRRGKGEALAELFDNGAMHFKSWLKRIEQASEEADVNILVELDQAGRKMDYQWNKLKAQALNKIVKRDETRISHSNKLTARLLPDGVLQERHDSVLYYLSTYGNEFVNHLISEIDEMTPQHIIVDLEKS